MPNILSEEEQELLFTHFPAAQKQKSIPRSKKKKILVIAGPTAVGKSRLALVIAKAIGGEIISADSMQVYRGMDIGTAKVSLDERREVPHHLIDSRDLDESFNVVEFYQEACHAIKEIFDKGGVPIVVGGTGFYIHTLIYGPPTGPCSVPEVRAQLELEMKEKGPEMLYERLKQLDPDYAVTITPRDRHKIVRALEIIHVAKDKVSNLAPTCAENEELYDFRCWFLYSPKELLYPQIEQRCEEMIARGFLEEVKHLEREGLSKNTIACQAIGYRQCLDYLNSAQTEKDWQTFVQLFKRTSKRYAKRQFTWFRREPLFRWLNVSKTSFETAAEIIIQDYEQSF